MEINTIITITQEIIFSLLMLIGLVFCAIGILGLFRFKDVYNKQHATGLIDTIGILFVCLSLAIKSGFALVSFKPIFLSLLTIFISAPLCYAFMQILIHREKDKILENIQEDKGE